MIWPSKNDASGTSPVPDHAERKEEAHTPDPKRKSMFVPYAFGRGARLKTQPSLTASDRKKLSDFAAKAKAQFEARKKLKSNV